MFVAQTASAAPVTQAGAAHPVYLLDCEGAKAMVRPKEFILACADAGTYVQKASWTNWGNATATAAATLTENNCVPSCVAGKFRSEPTTVTVSLIEKRHGIYEYRHLRVAPSPPNRYHFKAVSLTIPG
jgi:hypothetical protein